MSRKRKSTWTQLQLPLPAPEPPKIVLPPREVVMKVAMELSEKLTKPKAPWEKQ